MMASKTTEELYDAVAVRGGLTKSMQLEQLVSDLRSKVGDGHFEAEEPVESSRSGSTLPSARRAEDLSSDQAVAVANGMGIHRWQGRAELNDLIDGWPALGVHERETVRP